MRPDQLDFLSKSSLLDIGFQPSLFLKSVPKASTVQTLLGLTQVNGDLYKIWEAKQTEDKSNESTAKLTQSIFETRYFQIADGKGIVNEDEKELEPYGSSFFHKGGLKAGDIKVATEPPGIQEWQFDRIQEWSDALVSTQEVLQVITQKDLDVAQMVNDTKISIIDLTVAAPGQKSQFITSILDQLEQFVKEQEFLNEVLLEFLIEPINVKNTIVLYPDLKQTAAQANEGEEHPLEAILGPLSQSHQSFGRLFFPKDSTNRSASDCNGFLTLEHDKGNMRIFKKTHNEVDDKSATALDIAQLVNVIEQDKPIDDPSALRQLDYLTTRPQVAETFIKQVAFKIEKYSKFGA